MKRPVLFLGVILVVGVSYLLMQTRNLETPQEKVLEKPEEKPLEEIPVRKEEISEVRLTIVYDNNPSDDRLGTDWGFGCIVEVGDRNILFDTGADAETLLANMQTLSIDPQKINIIVLSHIHGDHVGGLFGVLERNSEVKVFLPSSFSQSFKDRVKSFGATVVEVSDPSPITKRVLTTGEMGTLIREQALIVETEKGLVVITGCAHPGVVNMVKKAKKITEQEVYLVMGGFHLSGASDSQLRDIVKDFRALGVQKVAPCHCSGDRCRELFKKEYGSGYIEAGVGKIFDL